MLACTLSGLAWAQPENDVEKRFSGKEFDRTVAASQNQAKAIAASITPEQLSGRESTYAERLFQSQALTNEVGRQATLNQKSVNLVTPRLMEETRVRLPQIKDINQATVNLRFGRHVVVSKDGEDIIDLIRSTATASPGERPALLGKLQALASRGAPEALNFMGFILEYGLFGAQSDMDSAVQYYKSASLNYQPAIYNLALACAYKRDPSSGCIKPTALMATAFKAAQESSYRVCGMASFLSFREKNTEAALAYAKNCYSPLANLAKAAADTRSTMPERVKLLRDTLATGVDDAYDVIDRITQAEPSLNNNSLHCKYKLVRRYMKENKPADLRSAARKCLTSSSKSTPANTKPATPDESIVAGVAGFVSVEIEQLKKMRATSTFHYSWSAPYLPFQQIDVDLFTPLISPASP